MPAKATRPLALLALFLAASAAGCEDEEEDGQTYACRYDYSTYSIDEYGSDYQEFTDNCTEVSSPERCDAITESSNECHGGFCSEWTYFNVEVHPGTCDENADEDGEACQWTNDGECDEAEGTGLCAEGTDSADC